MSTAYSITARAKTVLFIHSYFLIFLAWKPSKETLPREKYGSSGCSGAPIRLPVCSPPGVTAVLQDVEEVEEVRRVEGSLYSKINIIDVVESGLVMTDVRGGAVKKVERRYVG